MRLTDKTKEKINNYFNSISAEQLHELTLKYRIVEAGGKEVENYINFEDWKIAHVLDYDDFNNFLHDIEGWIKEDRLLEIYNSEVINI